MNAVQDSKAATKKLIMIKGPLPLTMDSCYIVPGEDLEFRYSIYLLSNDDVDAVFL